MNMTSDINKQNNKKQNTLWLWNAHNEVNKRLLVIENDELQSI